MYTIDMVVKTITLLYQKVILSFNKNYLKIEKY